MMGLLSLSFLLSSRLDTPPPNPAKSANVLGVSWVRWANALSTPPFRKTSRKWLSERVHLNRGPSSSLINKNHLFLVVFGKLVVLNKKINGTVEAPCFMMRVLPISMPHTKFHYKQLIRSRLRPPLNPLPSWLVLLSKAIAQTTTFLIH